ETYAGPEGTLAQAITSLSASSDPENVGEANLRMQVGSGPAGYSSISFQTRYSGSGTWRGAAIGLNTPSNAALPTQFWVNANQIIFYDEGGEFAPFIFEGG